MDAGRPHWLVREWDWDSYAVLIPTVTLLFTDIEGSTALLQRVGAGVYAHVLADHNAVIQSSLAAHGGQEVDRQGDGFFAVFSSPQECVAVVLEMQQALRGHAWPEGEHVRVRMGVHTGEAAQTPAAGLVGLEIHRAPGLPRLGTAVRCCCRRRQLSWCEMGCRWVRR